jgi:carboxylesterase
LDHKIPKKPNIREEGNPVTNELIMPTAEPFFFPGGETAILLVHGFTGTPKEMRWMGEYLAKKGHTVLGIRLTGHATTPQDMLRTRWQDWVASVEDGLHLLANYPKRYIMGLSMGGILSLYAAARYTVNAAVALSAPYTLSNDWKLKYINIFKYIQPNVPKGPSDWNDPTVEAEHKSYPSFPTVCIEELLKLLAETHVNLPQIKIPVLLVQSKKDSIPKNSMQNYYDQIGSQDKSMLWLEKSGHVITRDSEKETVFKAAADFVTRINGKQ